MADAFTTAGQIPILSQGRYWARRQLHAGIRYVPVASKPRTFAVFCGGGLREHPGTILFNG